MDGDKAITIGDVIVDYYGLKPNGNVDRQKVFIIIIIDILVVIDLGYRTLMVSCLD